ncbi:MAG: acyl--CoA ligase [Novosphingobium sp.]|nr:acyl--CoA ligase [Novosphingobium sp.]
MSEFPQPVMSIAEANALLTAPDGRFPMEQVTIDGREYSVYANVPATFRDLFDSTAKYADREYLVYEDERVTYEDFRRAASALANWLAEQGVRKGDRVAVVMRNLPEWFVAFYGAALAGAIVTPLNGWWTGPELEFGLADSGAKVAIVDPERLEVIAPHLDACPELSRVVVSRFDGPMSADPRISHLEQVIGTAHEWADLPKAALPELAMEPDDNIAILYTSGTTGRPKGALATHRNILNNVGAIPLPIMRAMLRWDEPLPPPVSPLDAPQRVNLVAVPLFHATGLVTQLILAANGGYKVVMMPRWNAAEAVRLIELEKVNVTGGVPTIAWQLLEEAESSDADLSSLTTIAYGGAPAAAELTRRIKARFPAMRMSTGWGMTETLATFTTASGLEYETHADTAGTAVPGNSFQIRDPDDGVTVLATGEVGELWARGPQVVKGYWNRPEANAETFVDGWLRTGDLGKLDEEGYLTLVDRAKDMVIRGGENIYCLEVENAIFEHPDVMDAAVVGIPHTVLGEEPAAVVRLARGSSADEDEIRQHVAARIARFKVPVRVLFLDENLPRNANGKIMKPELRAMFEEAATAT